MASSSEKSFGARLQNSKKFLSLLQSLSNYKTTRDEDSIAEYEKLIEICGTHNNKIASYISEYTIAIDKRSKAFLGKESTSLDKLLSPISKAVASQYNKTSKEYTSIMGIIKKMRSQSLEKSPKNPTEEQKDSISRSELSYGSRLQHFKDLIESLSTFANYAPANEDITIVALKKLVDILEQLNNEVNSKIMPLSVTRAQRITSFDNLSDRTQRIKASIASIYGNNSPEYKQIRNISV
jgi:hypothetical protein